MHEELQLTNSAKLNQPWIELTVNPAPFYAGWDANTNSVILTSKSLPQNSNNLPLRTINSQKSKLWEIYKNNSIKVKNQQTEKILDWPNYALTHFNGFITKNFQSTRLERYHFIKSFNTTFSQQSKTITLIELINQVLSLIHI